MRAPLLAASAAAAAGAPPKAWEVVQGAVLKGKEFKDAALAWRAAQGLGAWEDCERLCGGNATCGSFDFVGGSLLSGGAASSGIAEGDCWFRLDTVWQPNPDKAGKRNHTSGRYTAPAPTPSPAPAGAKNVLFIVFDDLRAMHAAYGWEQPHLPHADALAKESLVFDRAYVTIAVCGPSRASFLSGRRPGRTQMWNFINGDKPGGFRNAPGAAAWNTFPEWFKKHGYYVAGAGKLYHRGDPSGMDPPSWSEPECLSNFPFFGQGACPYSSNAENGGCAVDTQKYKCASRTNNTGDTQCFPDEMTLAAGIRFLRKGAAQREATGQPFWVGVGFVKPHLPHVFPDEFLAQVPALADIELAPFKNFTTDGVPMSWLGEGPTKGLYSPAGDASAQKLRQAYYAAAAFSDSLLGELLAEVDAVGAKDDTAVVLTADHGWGLGEHNHWIKYTNWETDVRVPLFVRAPWKSAAAGQRTAAIVESVDLYPSVAELVGVPVSASESVDGASWAAVLDTPSSLGTKDAAYSQYPRCWPEKNPTKTPADYDHMARCAGVEKEDFAFMGFSVRTAGWRYTEWAAWDGARLAAVWNTSAGVELYDHTQDTSAGSKTSFEEFENANVAGANPETVAALSAQLRSFFDGH